MFLSPEKGKAITGETLQAAGVITAYPVWQQVYILITGSAPVISIRYYLIKRMQG